VFVNAPELAGAAENKAAKPLYAAVVRIMGRAASHARIMEMARDMAGSLRVFSNPQGNALIPLHNEDYPFEEHLEDMLLRQSRRCGMILTSDELTGFVHLPSSAVRSLALQRETGRTKPAPTIVRQSPGVVIGDNEHNGETVPVFLTAEQRVRHTHIIGANGTGKSSLLLNMIRQDIENRDGVAVLDPHGDLIDQVLGCIPADRINDVVLVDLSDEEFPIGFNLLHAHSEIEKRLLASDLVGVFRRLSTSWGDQMDTVLQNAILAFLKNSRGGTLADLRRFLRDQKFRNEFLLTVRDQEVLDFWQEVFPRLGAVKSVSSLLVRLQEFFSQEPLRNMVSQRENKLDFEDIMDSGKIFLAKLSTGLGGEENSYLLGTLLIAKFQQLAMARQAQKIEARRDFWLYIDEFQHFISPSMEKILTGARKYRLGFTLSHQNLHQLSDDAKVASAVMTQPCTRIVLRVGDDDAKKLGDGFESFDAKSLMRLEKYHAIVRVEQNDFDFNLALRKPALPGGADERKAAVVEASRAQYATPRADVEAALMAEIRPDAGKTKPPEPPIGGGEPVPKPTPPPTPPTMDTTGSLPLLPAESLKTAEVPKAAIPPVKEIEKSTRSEMMPDLNPEEAAQTKTKDLGRGKAEHIAIQKRLQTEARNLGFTADTEKQLNKGSNESADVVVRLDDIGIAVEISVTTDAHQEFENVQKNLAAGFTRIAVVSTNPKKLVSIADAVQGGLGADAASKVSYHSPDDFIATLQKLAASRPQKQVQPPSPGQRTSHGRKVTVHFPQLSPEEQSAKDEAINKVMGDALKPPQGRKKLR